MTSMSYSTAADASNGEVSELDSSTLSHGDDHVCAPPVGLRGLLQQKDGSGPSTSLSNVGAIYGDIQRALVNFPRALQVTLLLLLPLLLLLLLLLFSHFCAR
jgi:hypothetical protein